MTSAQQSENVVSSVSRVEPGTRIPRQGWARKRGFRGAELQNGHCLHIGVNLRHTMERITVAIQELGPFTYLWGQHPDGVRAESRRATATLFPRQRVVDPSTR